MWRTVRRTLSLALLALLFLPVVFEQVMPEELRPRGIDNPDAVCAELARGVKAFQPMGGEPSGVSPEDVFRRLARS